MREKLATLPLSELREIARARGIRHVTGVKKADLIDRILELGEEKPKSNVPEGLEALDSKVAAEGILEVMPDGFGFIRCENYLPGDHDVYVSPSQIRRFNLKTGDIVSGSQRVKTGQEKFAALLYVNQINGQPTIVAERRPNFEDLTPIFPDFRLPLETASGSISMRLSRIHI